MSIQRDIRVAFVDRDGVINRDRDDYVKNVDEFEFLPGALDALRRLHESGWKVVIISNQAGVAKGLMSEEDLAGISDKITSGALASGGKITGFYYCLHRPEDGCDCRKPAPGLILRASRDLGTDPGHAVFVGDAERDIKAGKSAGCKTVLVLTGKLNAREAAEIDPAPDHIAEDLSEAVDWIIGQDC